MEFRRPSKNYVSVARMRVVFAVGGWSDRVDSGDDGCQCIKVPGLSRTVYRGERIKAALKQQFVVLGQACVAELVEYDDIAWCCRGKPLSKKNTRLEPGAGVPTDITCP